jgi:uncharacterized repeat protein (TIGR03803 family)
MKHYRWSKTLRIAVHCKVSLSLVACLVTAPAEGGWTLTASYQFNGANGTSPVGGVTVDASGNIYGTTNEGGINNNGTVFEIAQGSNTITTVANFNGTNGRNIFGGITLDAAGNMYGTTQAGGPWGVGTVFEIAKGSNTITTLATFGSSTGSNAGGAGPQASLAIDAAGNLYGTTTQGGINNWGTIFEVAKGSNSITTLAQFHNTDGSSPQAGLTMDAAGNLYGTTVVGGAAGQGTVFELKKGSSAVTTLASFNNGTGTNPQASVTLDSAGNIYGTTYTGLGSNGSVFEIPKGTTTLTTIYTFSPSSGQNPNGGLIMDAAGNLFGTTYVGGVNNAGTVFEIAQGSHTFTSLYSFSGPDGLEPAGNLAFDSAGNLYGATVQGGDSLFQGTVFELSPPIQVPEPASLIMIGQGAVALFGVGMWRRAKARALPSRS